MVEFLITVHSILFSAGIGFVDDLSLFLERQKKSPKPKNSESKSIILNTSPELLVYTGL